MPYPMREQDKHLLLVVKSEAVSLVAPLIQRAQANPAAPVDEFGNSITHIAAQTGNVELLSWWIRCSFTVRQEI